MSKALKSAGMSDAAIARIDAEAKTIEAWLERVAELLYEGGLATADTEGGPMPAWIELREFTQHWQGKGKKPGQSTRARLDWYRQIIRDHRKMADQMLGLSAADAEALAAELLARAKTVRYHYELTLWRRIERAEGRPAGSLARPLGERGSLEEEALIITGPPGSGKTHNALGLMAHFGKTILIEADDDVRWNILGDPSKLPPRALVLTTVPVDGALPIATALLLAGITPRDVGGPA